METVLETLVHDEQRAAALPQSSVREGSWDDYRNALGRCRKSEGMFDDVSDVIGEKRQHALAYLGRRALINGGICSRTIPRILTSQFVIDLEEANRNKRYARYPWLQRMMVLLAEIEELQDRHATTNIISLVPSRER